MICLLSVAWQQMKLIASQLHSMLPWSFYKYMPNSIEDAGSGHWTKHTKSQPSWSWYSRRTWWANIWVSPQYIKWWWALRWKVKQGKGDRECQEGQESCVVMVRDVYTDKQRPEIRKRTSCVHFLKFSRQKKQHTQRSWHESMCGVFEEQCQGLWTELGLARWEYSETRQS